MADNIARFQERLGASPAKLVAVTKNATALQVAEAFSAGVTEFGENRMQDALSKRQALPPSVALNSHWHFIGHLQTNKVKQAIGNFELIHSVDSLNLAREISKAASERSIVQAILLQVKIVVDPDKFGFTIAELKSQFAEILKLPNLQVRGLMTITPALANLATAHECFSGLSRLRNELEAEHGVKLAELSMGMTDDWQVAVQCGATMVRLGRGIFGH